VKQRGTKDLAESPTRPFREGHAQISRQYSVAVFSCSKKIKKISNQFSVTVFSKKTLNF
jgi:hypothetical protein